MRRRGSSSGGGASSLGYLFGSDAAPLTRPNKRAPPRPAPGPAVDSTMLHQQSSRYSPPYSRAQRSEHAGYPPSPGSGTPNPGYNTPTSGYDARAEPPPPSLGMLETNYHPSPMHRHQQSRAAGKVISDGGGMFLDMSGGSTGRSNIYYGADGHRSPTLATDRRVQGAPGGISSLGYLFGGA